MSEQRYPGVESKIVMLPDPQRSGSSYGNWYVRAWATFRPELEVLVRGRSRKAQEVAESAVAAMVTNDINLFDSYLGFIKRPTAPDPRLVNITEPGREPRTKPDGTLKWFP